MRISRMGRQLVIEGIESRDIGFRHLSNKTTDNFGNKSVYANIKLDPEIAETLAAEGWRIANLGHPEYAPSIKANWNEDHPHSYWRDGNEELELNKENLATLNNPIREMHLILNPSKPGRDGKFTAWVESCYAYAREDILYKRYGVGANPQDEPMPFN